MENVLTNIRKKKKSEMAKIGAGGKEEGEGYEIIRKKMEKKGKRWKNKETDGKIRKKMKGKKITDEGTLILMCT